MIFDKYRGLALEICRGYKGNLVQIQQDETTASVCETPGPFPTQNFKKH